MDEILYYAKLAEGFHTGGQPSERQFHAVKAAGVELVINLGLLDTEYALRDERQVVEALGLRYVHIPVVFDAPRVKEYLEFERTLFVEQRSGVLVHCAMNWRATAFSSMFALRNMGWSSERAKKYCRKFWELDGVWEQWVNAVCRLPEPETTPPAWKERAAPSSG